VTSRVLVATSAAANRWLDRLVAETEDGFGFTLKNRENELGYGAIATPMTLKGLSVALDKFGTRKFADLLAPAIHYTDKGFMVRPHVSAYWNQMPTEGRAPHADFLTRFAPTRKIYAKSDGRLHAVGDTLVNRDMVATFRRIASAGVEDFYGGDIAARVTADMKANGGLLSSADLASCQVEESKPLWGTYRGLKIATNPPPGGGVMLLEMLSILEHFDLRALGHNSPAYIAVVAEAMKIGAVDRDQNLGDPRFVNVPVEQLLSKDHAAAMAARIKSGEKTHVPRLNAKESADTTHVCVVDRDGMCVSLTHTLGTPSGVVTGGLGFMYNGAMGAFDPLRLDRARQGAGVVDGAEHRVQERHRSSSLVRRAAPASRRESCRRSSTWSISG
jgi:gamma-glutamyltranspeptidase/glutathione hydrolase